MGRDGRGVKAISKSSIEISFVYKGARCRERVPLKPTPANLKRAEQHRAAILFAISAGTFDYAATFPNSPRAAKFADYVGQVQTIETYLETWLERKKAQIKASTLRGYREMVHGLLIPKFGGMMVADFTRRHMKDWLLSIDEARDKPLSNKRLANIQSCLRSALDEAVEDGAIPVNPMAGWQFQRKDAPKKGDDIDPFAPEEQSELLRTLAPQARNLIQFAFWTGLRTSELIALNWADIDFVRGYVHVRKALTRAAKGVPETTKTRSGTREVKLLAPALAALREQKAYTFLAVGGEVFQHPTTGERYAGDHQIYRIWKTALKRAGVRYRRPYQTRHTFASMMLSAGEHPMWVARQMGHADWSMIARVYGRWMPSADTEAGNRAVELFSSASEEKQKSAGSKAA
ncbi:site-specific integrase [Bordetella avium]|uniref:Arm DNA-binding domain-containing protein n=1 Tax=Bordetella avium TaxID=521 RepID=UPI000FDC26B6|nr:DUF3596 domain-containing protein [Bordetella avium]AZY48824.1 site-specific integrase [Bordetella avium]